jgi:hypothetical protein
MCASRFRAPFARKRLGSAAPVWLARISKEKVISRQLYSAAAEGARSLSVWRARLATHKGARVMRATHIRQVLFGCLAAALVALLSPASGQAQSALNPDFAAGEANMSPSVRAGREIWFFATAFNDRFWTYSYPQRLGAAIDWYKILAAKNKRDLFQAWGAIPDPDCCVPGDANCPAKSLEETYGFQWCPGDAELLRFVGREGYRDPACDFKDAPFNTRTPHGRVDQRQDPCDLRFGTSTGALGLRKFPNPRFDAEKWKKLNGSLGSWEEYNKPLAGGTSPDARTNRLFDGSVEPPFRFGMSCGACHISHDPLKPAADPNNPKWENLDGLVGAQYSRISQILASGMPASSLEWQLIARSRPGAVDTSAIPMDTVANPGTMNAINNFGQRPLHTHRVLKWRKASSCPGGAATCWCEPAKPGKCWQKSEGNERVRHILKGGEDSIGHEEAIQRVYFNIGSCAEQCWLNHVSDARAADPAQRNYGQTPMDIGQCRRDCASFRAIEDRLGDVAAFFIAQRPPHIWQARGSPTPQELDRQLDQEFGAGSVARGQQVFARTCARCHSSQNPPFEKVDFRATVPRDPTLRKDFLSHEKPVLASTVGTNHARAMHSNHMPGRVWAEYSALSLWDPQTRPPDPNLREIMKGSGRGYYRPPSLLGVWAFAPFMHNNAMGPELCGKPSDPKADFYSPPYVDRDGKPLANPPACVPFDSTIPVEGRYKLFKDSMAELLNPGKRIPKVTLTDEDVIVDIAPQTTIGGVEIGLSMVVPKGKPAVLINSLRIKDLIRDLVLSKRRPAELAKQYEGILTPDRLRELQRGLGDLDARLSIDDGRLRLDISQEHSDFIQSFYSNALARTENAGHEFGKDLSDADKQALIAFLATL